MTKDEKAGNLSNEVLQSYSYQNRIQQRGFGGFRYPYILTFEPQFAQMDIEGILNIAGHPGLYKMIGQTKGGLIVESLIDGKRMAAYTSQRILALQDITVYTQEEDVPLVEIYTKMAEKLGKGVNALDPKKAAVSELRSFLKEVQPDYDEERVYTSDLKKLFTWYNVLVDAGIAVPEKKEEPKKKPAKKKAAKKETAKTESGKEISKKS